MQITRHWRLNRWRYRLEVEAPMINNHREHQEQRQFGALGLIHRQFAGEDQLLVLQDKTKTETVAGMIEWMTPAQPTWGFPGGGRGNRKPTTEGRIFPESLSMTLEHEIYEELGVAVRLLQTDLDKQAYPFLAAQLRLDEQRTDEFAVTSAWLEHDQLDVGQQHLIEKGVQEGANRWIKHEQLMGEFFKQRLYPNSRELDLEYRPQVLLASYVWYLQKICEQSPEEIAEMLIPLNQKTHGFIYADASRRTRPTQLHRVNNGAFQPDGQLIPRALMGFRDRRYLFPVEKSDE